MWLWDGWPFVFIWHTEPVSVQTEPLHLGDYFDRGCITADNLRAMANGQATTISCDTEGGSR